MASHTKREDSLATAPAPESMTDLILRADAAERAGQKLLNGTELAAIPATPENKAKAIQSIQWLTEQTRNLLKMSHEKRGMFLVWLKAHHAEPRKWQTFCRENFPDVSQPSIRRWMASYLLATGQKRPKELAREIDSEDVESDELVSAMMDPLAPADEKRTRKEVLHENRLLKKQIVRGKEQLEEARAKLENNPADSLPEYVKTATDAINHLRMDWYAWRKKWTDAIRREWHDEHAHFALFKELEQKMLEVWEDCLGPLFEELCEAEQQADADEDRPRK